MTTDTLQLRIKLSAAELHAVFTMLSVQQVIGIPNQLIFPADENMANQLYELGFQRLVANGWLQPDGRKFNTNNNLFLLASILAQPEKTIMVTRGFKEQAQTVTYYFGHQFIVEQYFNHENLYCISPLKSVETVSKNIAEFLELTADDQNTISTTVAKDQFAPIMGGDNKLEQLAILFNSHEIAQSFAGAKPLGEIEWGLFNASNSASVKTWALVKDPTTQQAFGLENNGGSVSIFSIDQTGFSQKTINF